MVRAAVGGAQLIAELWDDVRRGRAGLMRLGGTALLAGLAFLPAGLARPVGLAQSAELSVLRRLRTLESNSCNRR